MVYIKSFWYDPEDRATSNPSEARSAAEEPNIYLNDLPRAYREDMIVPPPSVCEEEACRWIVIWNIPDSATIDEVKALFTKAEPIHVKLKEYGFANIAFEPMTEATMAVTLFKKPRFGDREVDISFSRCLELLAFALPPGNLESMPWDNIRSKLVIWFKYNGDIPLGDRSSTEAQHVRRMVQDPDLMRKVPPVVNPYILIP